MGRISGMSAKWMAIASIQYRVPERRALDEEIEISGRVMQFLDAAIHAFELAIASLTLYSS